MDRQDRKIYTARSQVIIHVDRICTEASLRHHDSFTHPRCTGREHDGGHFIRISRLNLEQRCSDAERFPGLIAILPVLVRQEHDFHELRALRLNPFKQRFLDGIYKCTDHISSVQLIDDVIVRQIHIDRDNNAVPGQCTVKGRDPRIGAAADCCDVRVLCKPCFMQPASDARDIFSHFAVGPPDDFILLRPDDRVVVCKFCDTFFYDFSNCCFHDYNLFLKSVSCRIYAQGFVSELYPKH